MTQRHVSVVIADDHPVVLCSLGELLNREPDLTVVATCRGGVAALEAIRNFKPQVAILDIAMPDLGGLNVLATLALERSTTKVIFLTAFMSEAQLHTAISSGARGLMLKDSALDDLARGIREVAANRTWFPSERAKAAYRRAIDRPASWAPKKAPLTPRELQVMQLASEGLSNKEVARRLALTEGTVKIHLHHIYQKVGVANRTALAARWSEAS